MSGELFSVRHWSCRSPRRGPAKLGAGMLLGWFRTAPMRVSSTPVRLKGDDRCALVRRTPPRSGAQIESEQSRGGRRTRIGIPAGSEPTRDRRRRTSSAHRFVAGNPPTTNNSTAPSTAPDRASEPPQWAELWRHGPGSGDAGRGPVALLWIAFSGGEPTATSAIGENATNARATTPTVTARQRTRGTTFERIAGTIGCIGSQNLRVRLETVGRTQKSPPGCIDRSSAVSARCGRSRAS